MKNFLPVVMLTFFGLTYSAIAQDTEQEAPLEISGSVDTYFTADFSGQDNIPTSFADNREAMSIGMLDIALSKSFENVSFTGEFSFGPRSFKSIPTFDPDGDGEGPQIFIQNLYVSYGLTDKLTLTAGYMGTFVGYEVISPAGNFNYSTSYLFTSGPFQNAGIKADYAFSDRFAVMVGMFNDWNVYADADGMKDIGAQIYFAPVDGWDVYLNFVNGKSSGNIFDITTGYQVSDKFYLGLNAADFTYDNSNDGGYTGVALYPQVALTDAFSLGLRTEFFGIKETKDESGTILTEKGGVSSYTLTANYKVGGFTFIPEVRLDSSDDLGFLDKNGEAASKAAQVTFAAVYAF